MTRHQWPLGLFIKTPAPHIVEILALADLDFAVLDAEHAPFDRAMLDMMMLAGRATGLPLLVRVSDTSTSTIGAALDLGAAGVMVPHVASIDMARAVVASTRYHQGARGYSSAPRHAGYGALSMIEAIAAAHAVQVLVQIEHPDAALQAGEILALDGVDGIVIGRADLTIALGESDTSAPRVEACVQRIFDAVRSSTKIKGVVVSSAAERERYAALGANWFIMGSDQSLLRAAAKQLLSA